MEQYCPSCGTKVESNSKFCMSCGYDLKKQNSNQNTLNNAVKTYTNVMGIIGLVISIVSLVLCCGSISFIGLIFSIIGLNNAKKNNGIGKGISITGLIINLVGLVLLIFWMVMCLIPFVTAMTLL